MDIVEYLQTKERRKQFYDAINNWHESELNQSKNEK